MIGSSLRAATLPSTRLGPPLASLVCCESLNRGRHCCSPGTRLHLSPIQTIHSPENPPTPSVDPRLHAAKAALMHWTDIFHRGHAGASAARGSVPVTLIAVQAPLFGQALQCPAARLGHFTGPRNSEVHEADVSERSWKVQWHACHHPAQGLLKKEYFAALPRDRAPMPGLCLALVPPWPDHKHTLVQRRQRQSSWLMPECITLCHVSALATAAGIPSQATTRLNIQRLRAGAGHAAYLPAPPTQGSFRRRTSMCRAAASQARE